MDVVSVSNVLVSEIIYIYIDIYIDIYIYSHPYGDIPTLMHFFQG